MRSNELLYAIKDMLVKEFREDAKALEEYTNLRPKDFFVTLRDDDGKEHLIDLDSINLGDGIAIYIHDLPRDLDVTNYPFIVIRLASGKMGADDDGFNGCTEVVELILGIYEPDSPASAGRRIAALLDRLRLLLRHHPLLAKKFNLILPVTFEVPPPDRTVIEYQMATLTTTWQYNIPQLPLLYEEDRSNKNGI